MVHGSFGSVTVETAEVRQRHDCPYNEQRSSAVECQRLIADRNLFLENGFLYNFLIFGKTKDNTLVCSYAIHEAELRDKVEG
jgi:hypothetical protein